MEGRFCQLYLAHFELFYIYLASSDSVIGLSDGLTVPFALTAGLASLGNSRVVVLGGVAELIAGAISMGIGAFCMMPIPNLMLPR